MDTSIPPIEIRHIGVGGPARQLRCRAKLRLHRCAFTVQYKGEATWSCCKEGKACYLGLLSQPPPLALPFCTESGHLSATMHAAARTQAYAGTHHPKPVHPDGVHTCSLQALKSLLRSGAICWGWMFLASHPFSIVPVCITDHGWAGVSHFGARVEVARFGVHGVQVLLITGHIVVMPPEKIMSMSQQVCSVYVLVW